MEQRAPGTMLIWANPFTSLRVPKIFNLRTDPYERADITSNTYYDWLLDHVFLMVPAQAYVGQFLMTFKDYPQRQKADSFNLDEVLRKLKESAGEVERASMNRGSTHRAAPIPSGCGPIDQKGHDNENQITKNTLPSRVPGRLSGSRRDDLSCLEHCPRQRTGRRPSPSCTPTTCTRPSSAWVRPRTTRRSRSTTTRPGAGTRVWPRLIAKRKEARKDQGPVLVLDAGDYSMGTAFGAATRETGGELQLMSRMGYDATTFGNHEFDLGPDGLGKSIGVAAKAGRVPAVLASNTNFAANDATLADLQRLAKDGVIRRHLVIERGGIRFGIFGVLGKEAMFYTSGAGAVTFADAIETAKEMVKVLRETEKVDVVIASQPRRRGERQGRALHRRRRRAPGQGRAGHRRGDRRPQPHRAARGDHRQRPHARGPDREGRREPRRTGDHPGRRQADGRVLPALPDRRHHCRRPGHRRRDRKAQEDGHRGRVRVARLQHRSAAGDGAAGPAQHVHRHRRQHPPRQPLHRRLQKRHESGHRLHRQRA